MEQLLNVEVSAVSKFAQRADETPAAVTVITREDIRAFGYRTLAEVLRGVRGFYFTSDRTYQYVGVRGFAPPGDYNDRVLLLVDGFRMNDTVYDQGYFGTDAPIDLELVERIEVVRGPGASAYGSNALFGVVNVVTRRAADIGRAEITGEVGPFGSYGAVVLGGLRLDDGSEFVLSASGFRTPGPDLYFPEFDDPATSNGRIDGADFDRNGRAYFKSTGGPLTVSGGYSRRVKGNGASTYGTTFNDARNAIRDETAFLDLKLETSLGSAGHLTSRLFAGRHYYYGDYLYGPPIWAPPVVDNPDLADALWWGGEVRLLSELSPRQKLLIGVEYQRNERQDQKDYLLDPYTLILDSRQKSERAGLFAQTDYRWSDALLVNAGLRYDKSTGQSGELSPRIGAVFRQDADTLWKAQYGSAFRSPNVYERFYEYPAQQIGNAGLRPEKIQTLELTYERYLSASLRLTLAGYYYRMKDLIAQVPVDDPANPGQQVLQYQNQPVSTGRGLEAELEGRWDNGLRLRTSYAYQIARNEAGEDLENSPRHLLKANATAPLGMLGLRAGLELQATSSRRTWNGRTPGFGLVNLTLLRPSGPEGIEVSASILNLFDKEFSDPAILDLGLVPYGYVRDRIPQPGRGFRLKLTFAF